MIQYYTHWIWYHTGVTHSRVVVYNSQVLLAAFADEPVLLPIEIALPRRREWREAPKHPSLASLELGSTHDQSSVAS